MRTYSDKTLVVQIKHIISRYKKWVLYYMLCYIMSYIILYHNNYIVIRYKYIRHNYAFPNLENNLKKNLCIHML